jgi:uncharacterized membrane protein
MPRTLDNARVLLALAFAGFGLQYLRVLPIAGPPWYPVQRGLSIVAGVALLAAAIGLLVSVTARAAAMLLSLGLLLRLLLFHLPQLVHHFRDPGIWTVFGEVLALAGGACILAAALTSRERLLGRVLAIGRYLFAAPLVLFGILHFRYAFFISTLIPDWIPGRFFFANFTGLCFVCAALAIVTGVRARLAGYLLATMFLLWVGILHAPRVARAIHSGNEWTSLFVALAMTGCALAVAASHPWRTGNVSDGSSS